MKMSDKEFDNLLKETMRWEADRIMDEVESAPEMKDVVAPEGMFEDFQQNYLGKKQKQAKEKQEKEPHRRLSPEEQELIRLGMKYRKNHGKGKYFILVAAIVCALGVGTISIGGKEKVFTEVKRIFSGREQTLVNSGDEDRHIDRGNLTEQNAYEEINEKFGFYPVKLFYLPEGIVFVESVIEKDTQSARLHYSDEKARSITYRMVTNYRDGSVGIDVEDTLIHEYEKPVDKTIVKIQQYKVEGAKSIRWHVQFEYKEVQYTIILMGFREQEIDKVIENLYFN